MKKASWKKSESIPKPKKSVEPKKIARPKAPASNAVLEFLPNWVQKLQGELRQAGKLILQYDPERLTACRGTHNGLPCWTMESFVKFQPGGQLTSGNLVRLVDDATGQVITPPQPIVLTVDVPADAVTVELWFKNSDIWGNEAWDSRMGENYRFDVQPGRVKPAVRATPKARK